MNEQALTCPPCTGTCNQGRSCPDRLKRFNDLTCNDCDCSSVEIIRAGGRCPHLIDIPQSGAEMAESHELHPRNLRMLFALVIGSWCLIAGVILAVYSW
jgi:hypothetical protein